MIFKKILVLPQFVVDSSFASDSKQAKLPKRLLTLHLMLGYQVHGIWRGGSYGVRLQHRELEPPTRRGHWEELIIGDIALLPVWHARLGRVQSCVVVLSVLQACEFSSVCAHLSAMQLPFANQVELLMQIFVKYAARCEEEAVRHGLRVRVLATDRWRLPPAVLEACDRLERVSEAAFRAAATAAAAAQPDEAGRRHRGFRLNLCVSYGARSDLARAARRQWETTTPPGTPFRRPSVGAE